jgi:hypothetical protein
LDVDEIAIAGTWLRHVPGGSDVWHRPVDPADSRWQRGAAVDALYFGDSEETVWAEWYRWLAEAALPPEQGLPRDLWRFRVALPRVADLRGSSRLARVGLPRLAPSRLQWPEFQPVGEALFAGGWAALVCDSAARPSGSVLCVFRRLIRPTGVRAVRPPTRVDAPPVVPTGMRT